MTLSFASGFARRPQGCARDLRLEDRGFLDGKPITWLKQQRHIDVMVPLQANMVSDKDAVRLADLQGTGNRIPPVTTNSWPSSEG